MSTDPIGAALTPDHPAVGAGATRVASEQSCELTGIATAIERVEALLASVGPEPERSDAVERIADIAFVLHERDVEASLCDALDAAVRELGNANGAKQTNVRHVRQAAELLRELSQRVGDMIALLQVSPPCDANDPAANIGTLEEAAPAFAEQPASADTLDGDIPREGLFTAETLEDGEFARAVAELAASLPALAAPVEAVVVTLHQPADPATGELALAPEPEQGVIGAQDESDSVAGSESAVAPEPAEAFFETHSQPDKLVTEQPDLSPRLEEAATGALAETQRAIEQPIAHEDEISATELSAEPSNHEAIAAEVLAGESAMSETLSEETLAGGADIPAQPADLPGALSVNGHAVVSPAGADIPTPGRETALSPDNSPVAVLTTQSELPPTGDVPAPPADAAGPAGQPSDQNTHRIVSDEPAQIAGDSLRHDIDEPVAETAVPLEEEMPPRVVNSSQALLPELALVDPQDDPGDLFEPPTGAALPTADPAFIGSQSASEISTRAAAMRTRSSAAAADPVAAMRTLGAEELLALFT